jgi:hypothetical protein
LASIHHPPCDGGVAHRLREPRTTDNLPNGSLLTWSVTNEAAVMLPDQAFSRATGTNVDSAFNQTTRLIKRIIHRRRQDNPPATLRQLLGQARGGSTRPYRCFSTTVR